VSVVIWREAVVDSEPSSPPKAAPCGIFVPDAIAGPFLKGRSTT
jgi:hypothetical protein